MAISKLLSKGLKKVIKKKPSAKTVKEKAKARAKSAPSKSRTSTTKGNVFAPPEATVNKRAKVLKDYKAGKIKLEKPKTTRKQPKDMRTAAQLKKERERVIKFRKRMDKELDAGNLSKATLREAETIIKLRTKTMAGPQETKLRAQKEKLKATKPKTAEARAAKKAKIKEINKKIFKITGRMEGMKNTFSEARNMTPYAGRKTRRKTGGLK